MKELFFNSRLWVVGSKFLIVLLLTTFYILPTAYSQDFGIYDLSAKTNLDSADAFMISQRVDSTYYKVLFDRIVDSVEDSIRGQIINSWIKSGAAIAVNKLASGTAGYVLMANGSGVPTYTNLTGDVTINSAGVTAIGSNALGTSEITDNTIMNADINSSAAIAYSKLNLSNSIVSADITDGTITGTDISDESITTSDIDDGTILDADISASAGITLSKLATSTAANIIVYNGSGVPTSVSMSGDATITNAGVVDLADALSDNFTFSGVVTHSGRTSFTSAIIMEIDSVADPGSGTVSVSSGQTVLRILGEGGTITDFDNAYDGQILYVICSPYSQGGITIDNGAEIKLNGNVDYAMDTYDTLTLIYDSDWEVWYEIARSDNDTQ